MGDPESQEKKYHYYENPVICSGCHWDKFDRWSTSQHSKGFTGDFFQAQFYEVVLPSLSLDEKVAGVFEHLKGKDIDLPEMDEALTGKLRDINGNFPVDELIKLACNIDQDVKKTEGENRKRKDLDDGFCDVTV